MGRKDTLVSENDASGDVPWESLSSFMGFSQRFQIYQIISVVYVCLLVTAAVWLPEAKPIRVRLKRNAWKGVIYETSHLQEPHSLLVSGYERAWVRCPGCPHLIVQPDSFNHEHTNWENTKAFSPLKGMRSLLLATNSFFEKVGFGYGVVVVGEDPISAPPMEISSKVDLVYKKYFRTWVFIEGKIFCRIRRQGCFLSKQALSLLACMFFLSYVFVCCISMHACVFACIFMYVCAGVLVHRCECIWRSIC